MSRAPSTSVHCAVAQLAARDLCDFSVDNAGAIWTSNRRATPTPETSFLKKSDLHIGLRLTLFQSSEGQLWFLRQFF